MTPTIGLVVGVSVFLIVFYFSLTTVVKEKVDTPAAEEVNYLALSAALADILMMPGSGWYDGSACVAGGQKNQNAFRPDLVGAVDANGAPTGRFGIGDEGCGRSATDPLSVHNLSFEKFQNLPQASVSSDPSNGRVDYEEARLSLGLGDGPVNFHLRTAPILATSGQILRLDSPEPVVRPLYVGDYVDGLVPLPRPTVTASGTAEEGANYVYLNVTVQNDPLSIAAAFQVDFSVELEDGTIAFTKNGVKITAGQSITFTAKIAKTKDWRWANPGDRKASYTVSDPIGPIVTGTISFGNINMAQPANNQNNLIPVLSMDRLVYVTGFDDLNRWPRAVYNAYTGSGVRSTTFGGAQVDLRVADGLLYNRVYADPLPDGQNLQDALLLPGTYTVELWLPDLATGSIASTDRMEVLDPFGLGTDLCGVALNNFAPSNAAVEETGWIDELHASFDRAVPISSYGSAQIPYDAAGDVLPDVKCTLNSYLPGLLTDNQGAATLAQYTTLVVGSDLDHGALSSEAVKGAIRAWVQAGGTVVVLGSPSQSGLWLTPLFQSSVITASGGLRTPDPQHPILSTPNGLDYTAYQYSSEWNLRKPDKDKFTQIVLGGGQGTVLATSNPGSFGDGRIILTSWRPYDLTANQATACPAALDEASVCQSLLLLHNLAAQSYGDLFLDYGARLPPGVPVGVQSRLVNVYHPDLQQTITLELQVYVFAGSG